MPKSQVFFWLLAAFFVGIAIASFVALPTVAVAAIFLCGVATAVFGTFRGASTRVAVAGWCAVVVAFGALWFVWQGHAREDGALPTGQRLTLQGVVGDEPERANRTQRLVIRHERGAKILATTRLYPEYRYGDRLQLTGTLRPPENFSDDFDYVTFLAKDDIFLVMVFPEIVVLQRHAASRFIDALLTLKSAFRTKLNTVLPEPHASLLGGILLGARESLPAELRDDLRRTGTIHLIAISGYNVSIVASAFLRFLGVLLVPFAAAFWIAVSAIVAFALITGASASVVRASIMAGIVLLARREGRPHRMRNVILLAAAVMVAANPKILRFDIGFQLSFLATLGIVYGTPLVDAWLERCRLRLTPLGRGLGIWRRPERSKRPQRSFLRETLATTIAAQLFVLPLLIWHFGNVSLVSPLANLAILPVIPATMAFGFFAGIAASAATFLGRVVATPVWLLLGYVLAVIETAAALPFAAVAVHPWSQPAAILVAGAVAAGVVRYYRHAAP